jgi:hypothetical protein
MISDVYRQWMKRLQAFLAARPRTERRPLGSSGR